MEGGSAKLRSYLALAAVLLALWFRYRSQPDAMEKVSEKIGTMS